MARSFPLPCEPEMKWVFKAGINIDPATLAKNLTILCTVAFSATVFYVMYSNSKRPQYNRYTQVSLSDDEELSDEEHTTHCKTRCRHSIVGNSDRTRPPDRLMNFGIPLDDVQSPSSRPAYCPIDSTVDVNMARDGLRDESLTSSGTLNVLILPSTASESIATNDVDTSAGMRQDDNSFKSCGIDDAEAQTMPAIIESVLNASSDVSVAAEAFVDGGLLSIESSFSPTILPPTISTGSGPDLVETPSTQILPSTSSDTAPGDKVFESSCTQTLPPTTSTPTDNDVTAAGRLDDTCLCSGFTKDPDFTRAKVGFLRHLKEGESPVRNWENLDAIQCESMEREDDGGSHFEGYIYGIIREKGSKSYKRRLYGGVSFAKGRREQGDGGCSRERIDFGESDGARFHEACTRVEKGVEVCENISIGRPHKNIVEGIRKKNLDFVSSLDGCVNTLSRECRPRQRDSCTQTEVKDKRTSMTVDSICASSSREASRERFLKQLPTMRKDQTSHLLGNNFECRDKGSSKFVEKNSASSARGPCAGRPLKQLPPMAKEESRHLLGNNFEKCRDKDTSTYVDTFPASRTREAWTGRPFKQTRTMPKEETYYAINKSFGVSERCAEEREGGITSVQREPVDPLEQTKSSLKTLTETEHWSKMSLPEQYECLGLLDSTLAAASGEY
jgi:hypothetical protein